MLRMMRRKLQLLLARAFHWLTPQPDQSSTIRYLSTALAELASREDTPRARYMERLAELVEARQMAGAGPWTVGPIALEQTDRILTEAAQRFDLKESGPPAAPGAYGDIELALMNVEWRREINVSWLEF